MGDLESFRRVEEGGPWPLLLPPEAELFSHETAVFEAWLFRPFAYTFDKYTLHLCCVLALGQVLGTQYSVPGL